MIKASHKKWARFLFNPYCDWLLKRNFSQFLRVNNYPYLSPELPLIITPNHISWWDGFFIDYLARRFIDRRGFILMLEEQLSRYWFFKKIGAFSIDPTHTKKITETVKYVHNLLHDPNNFVILYPQGEIEPYEMRPLTLKRGLRLFLKETPEVQVLLVGFKIQYYNQKKPSLLVKFGETLSGIAITDDFKNYEDYFYDNLDSLSCAAFNKSWEEDMFGSNPV
jgi:1-acyl-sn-glycerol-3-phosphate acyltransferase